jgi:glutamate/tyrosine decarboxylase-like PLP-dependent enzyme
MDRLMAGDHASLSVLLEEFRRRAVGALEGMADRPVVPARVPPEPVPLPGQGAGLRETLDIFETRWGDLLSASTGPRYLGFVTGGTTPAALVGDWTTAVWDQNPVSRLDGAGQALERETVGWVRELLGLPGRHHGAFVSGASMSNLVGLAVAREWLGERKGVSPAQAGAAALGPVRVLSGSAHSSVPKALALLGLGRRSLIQVPTLPGREAVDPAALARCLDQIDGPCVVVANAGTVNTGDFDDLRAIAALRARHDFWLHADGAFGAFAGLLPSHARLVDGLELADSICVDLHKWLNVPYGSAVQFTPRLDLQSQVFQNAAAYLGTPADAPDLVHLTPENSRRLRALAAWFTLRAYGRDGHREIVERCVACAEALAAAVARIPGLRLLAPVRLNVVCFTLTGKPTSERLAALAERVSDEVFLSPTVLDGVPALRAAFSNWSTTLADVGRIAAALARGLSTL